MYSQVEKAYIWLDSFDFITMAKKNEIIRYYGDYDNISKNVDCDFAKFKLLVTEDQYNVMKKSIKDNQIDKIINDLDKKDIYVICRSNTKYYPEKLYTLDPPFCLYTKGDIELLKSRYTISVVGSRQPSKYGKNITEKFTRELAKNGFVIISGLAYGVDYIAHISCLQEGGKTIAVLGSGFDHVYPAQHTSLFEKIVTGGGLAVSEYRPEVEPAGYHFPNRNRVIVGISNGVIITEATEKSGTMYTKDYAIDSGTELMVVPGNIDSQLSAGCNRIIKEFPSTMVTSVKDIFDVYDFTNEQKISESDYFQLNLEEQLIISVIGDQEVHYDEILTKTQIPSKNLNITLTGLQLKGVIKKLPGNNYEIIK